jgi:predicted pyridoxine 5'-phosphate oxidase superfamily flavin-nucleotide-binding protein
MKTLSDLWTRTRRLKRALAGRRSSNMYHDGNRALQDEFGSRKLADRLVQELSRNRFTDGDKQFVESSPFFFLATADAEGRPDCSFKGGLPGFARVLAPDLLVFPDYDGNGMFKSLGNISVNPQVGMLFMRLGEKPGRLRINGRAEISRDDPLIAGTPGAQLLIKVTPIDIFPNCPRYIPHLELMEPSVYAPVAGAKPVEPAWKSSDTLKDVVPPRRR